MTLERDDVARYFRENAAAWIGDAYSGTAHAYPVGLRRQRIVLDFLERTYGADSLDLLDVGCGGGDLCVAASALGHRTTGVDGSSEMIALAEDRRRELAPEVAEGITFVQSEFDEIGSRIEPGSYDVVTAMGFIGYLPGDHEFFELVSRFLRPGGHALVSCRNRLFNLQPGSRYLAREIDQGSLGALEEEAQHLYQPVPPEVTADFLTGLADAAGRLLEAGRQGGSEGREAVSAASPEPQFTTDIEARQHTPGQIVQTAASCGLETVGLYGVHPHLLGPAADAAISRAVLNELSDCLCVFERHPVSLTWSSVFIAAFRKAGETGLEVEPESPRGQS